MFFRFGIAKNIARPQSGRPPHNPIRAGQDGFVAAVSFRVDRNGTEIRPGKFGLREGAIIEEPRCVRLAPRGECR